MGTGDIQAVSDFLSPKMEAVYRRIGKIGSLLKKMNPKTLLLGSSEVGVGVGCSIPLYRMVELEEELLKLRDGVSPPKWGH